MQDTHSFFFFKCALHWMLSYSVNTTFRSDEIFWASDFGVQGPYAKDVNYNHGGGQYVASAGRGAGTQAGQVGYYAPEYYDLRERRPPYGSPAFWLDHTERPKWRDCELSQAKSRSPWEMGVIWSETGLRHI